MRQVTMSPHGRAFELVIRFRDTFQCPIMVTIRICSKESKIQETIISRMQTNNDIKIWRRAELVKKQFQLIFSKDRPQTKSGNDIFLNHARRLRKSELSSRIFESYFLYQLGMVHRENC